MSIPYFDRLKREYEKGLGDSAGRLKLMFSKRTPVARAYIFDSQTDNGLLVYTPYLNLKDSTVCPALKFSKSDEAFAAFEESAMHHVDRSTVYFDSNATT